MISGALAILGEERAFEMIEFLVLFFFLVLILVFILLLASRIRSLTAERTINKRLERVVRRLGRDLFGDDGWQIIERTVPDNGKRVDNLLSALDRELFDNWAARMLEKGIVRQSEVRMLEERLMHYTECRRVSAEKSGALVFNPSFGTPVAVLQDSLHVRGTIAEVDSSVFTVLLMSPNTELDDSKTATFAFLSRNGVYEFDSDFSKRGDDMLQAERPASITRTQRRRFERYPTKLPVIVNSYLGESPPVNAVITELSGGGATVTNPMKLFSVGNVMNLSFSTGDQYYSVAGRVVHISDDSRQLHVRFEAMKDQLRYSIAESVSQNRQN